MNLLMILVIIPSGRACSSEPTPGWSSWAGRGHQPIPPGDRLFDQPLKMIHNTFGVYVGMVHILLPYMILPIYSVMKELTGTWSRLLRAGSQSGQVFHESFPALSLPGVFAGPSLFSSGHRFLHYPGPPGGLTNVMISMLIERQVTSC